jgi:Fe-S-cluster containining protein
VNQRSVEEIQLGTGKRRRRGSTAPDDPVTRLPPLPRDYSREEALAELDKLYACLPALTCRGLCHSSCGVVVASELEHQRIADTGASIGPRMSDEGFLREVSDSGQQCPALGPLRNCTIYPIRPFICRAYGVGAGLRCPHGCVPDRVVPDAEIWELMARIEQLSRHITDTHSWPA